MNLRVEHALKGKYPVVIFTMPNNGGVSRRGKKYYIMTFRQSENDLYFHALTRFTHKYNPKDDFSLRIDKFKQYTLEFLKIGGAKASLISYKNDYFPFGFFTGTYDTKEGENNLDYILSELKNRGISYTSRIDSDIKKGEHKHE
ncbi:MAG: hypothetical protein K6G28_03515 [Acholeplasmatales bacterium]|nr:hypothetical protein [Acholeplasmatales bacterium]